MQKSQFGALFRKGERVGEVDENGGYVALRERERETERERERERLSKALGHMQW